MAWGRKKSGGRKEPQFGLGASLADLRLSPEDRVPAAAETSRRNQCPSANPPTTMTIRRASASRARPGAAPSAAPNRAIDRLGRLFYWGAVLGLWAVIAVIGVVVWVGAHLPAIQSLEFQSARRRSRSPASTAACWPRAAKWPAPMSR